jgi:hypothetical protein
MKTTFLAEDFRRMLEVLENLNNEKEDSSEKEQHSDVDDLLNVDRPENIDKDSIEDVKSLIDYLDQFPALSKYRDLNASFDDAYYADVPMTELERISDLTEEDLNRISDAIEQFSGEIVTRDDKVSVFGAP